MIGTELCPGSPEQFCQGWAVTAVPPRGKAIGGATVTDDAMLGVAVHLRSQELSPREIAAVWLSHRQEEGPAPVTGHVMRMLREHDEKTAATDVNREIASPNFAESGPNGGNSPAESLPLVLCLGRSYRRSQAMFRPHPFDDRKGAFHSTAPTSATLCRNPRADSL